MRLFDLAFGGWRYFIATRAERLWCRIVGHDHLGVNLYDPPHLRPSFEECWTCRRCGWLPGRDLAR